MDGSWVDTEIYSRLLQPLSESGEQGLRASLRQGLSEAATDDVVEAAILIDGMFTARLANSPHAEVFSRATSDIHDTRDVLNRVLESDPDLLAEVSQFLDEPRPRSGMTVEGILQAWTTHTTSPFDMPMMQSVAAIPSTTELLAARRIKQSH
jgi:hypothetical protein